MQLKPAEPHGIEILLNGVRDLGELPPDLERFCLGALGI